MQKGINIGDWKAHLGLRQAFVLKSYQTGPKNIKLKTIGQKRRKKSVIPLKNNIVDN
jgi:hypothetical protein